MIVLIVTILILAAILACSVWVALGLIGCGISIMALFHHSPVLKQLGMSIWNTSTGETIIALPLFILMSEILFKTKLGESMFSGLAPWVTWMPGRLVHTNVLGCTIFAAVSGSSAATTATIGRVTLGELDKRKYKRQISIGSLAGAGTLGFMIPPSNMMIIYGVLAEESILKLFIAGIIPGCIIAGAYSVFIVIYSLIYKDVAPKEKDVYSARERLKSLIELGPVTSLILLMIVAMYGGYASPSEAAAVGVLGSVIISLLQKSMTFQGMKEALISAARTNAMVGLIIIAAVYLSQAMAFINIPRYLAEQMAMLNLSPITLIAVLLIFYIFLGSIMEGLSIMVMTLPITLPLVLQAGYDKIWFGIFMVLVVEMAQITPPVGFNLFVIQGLSGESLGSVAKAAFPFFIIMVVFSLLIAVYPEIVAFLPGTIKFSG